jgi:hypothetical protein
MVGALVLDAAPGQQIAEGAATMGRAVITRSTGAPYLANQSIARAVKPIALSLRSSGSNSV